MQIKYIFFKEFQLFLFSEKAQRSGISRKQEIDIGPSKFIISPYQYMQKIQIPFLSFLSSYIDGHSILSSFFLLFLFPFFPHKSLPHASFFLSFSPYQYMQKIQIPFLSFLSSYIDGHSILSSFFSSFSLSLLPSQIPSACKFFSQFQPLPIYVKDPNTFSFFSFILY